MSIKAIITMQEGGTITVELDPSNAPNTVRNFVDLARKGFYDGLIFHRVIPGFMIQGGCPKGQGTGGPGYSIAGEFSGNGHKNSIRHERGVISMARAGHPDSAGSQFFIMHKDASHLDGQYAAFGKVQDGMEVVDRIAATRTGPGDRPIAEQRIDHIEIEADPEDESFLEAPVTL